MYQRLQELADQGSPPPTLVDLCRSLGLRSRGSLHKHVQALVNAGLVCPMEGLHRGIRLTEEPSGATRRVPWLGHIAAGRPIEALSENEFLEIPAILAARGDCYALKVRGDSMIEVGILDGDWVIIEHRSHARDGEIVVALVDGEEATLKRIRQGRDQVTLLPANSGMEALQYSPDRVRIQGVLVGQMRTYR